MGEPSFRTEAYAWSLRGAERPAVMAWWRADDVPALATPPLETVGLAKQIFDNPVLVIKQHLVIRQPPTIARSETIAIGPGQ